MRKLLAVIILLLFIGMSVIPSLGGTAVEKTIIMDSESGSYIQDLIDNASDGDTINIPSGTYYENVVINKSISLIGEDKDTTIIDGDGVGSVVHIIVDNVKISKFTIQNSGWKRGLEAGIKSFSNYNIISENNIRNNGQIGVLFYTPFIYEKQGNYNTIKNNYIHHNNDTGIFIMGYPYDTIGTNNKITGNVISSNKGYGIKLGSWCSKLNEVSKNIIKNNMRDGIVINVGHKTTIYMNHIENNGNGIYIWDGKRPNLISKNNFIGNDAYFDAILFPNIRRIARWRNNYWDNWEGFGVKLIPGKVKLIDIPYSLYLEINWSMFDLLPAKEPYDIEGVI